MANIKSIIIEGKIVAIEHEVGSLIVIVRIKFLPLKKI